MMKKVILSLAMSFSLIGAASADHCGNGGNGNGGSGVKSCQMQ